MSQSRLSCQYLSDDYLLTVAADSEKRSSYDIATYEILQEPVQISAVVHLQLLDMTVNSLSVHVTLSLT